MFIPIHCTFKNIVGSTNVTYFILADSCLAADKRLLQVQVNVQQNLPDHDQHCSRYTVTPEKGRSSDTEASIRRTFSSCSIKTIEVENQLFYWRTLTLTTASLGGVTIPATMEEPLIAGSIVKLAFETRSRNY